MKVSQTKWIYYGGSPSVQKWSQTKRANCFPVLFVIILNWRRRASVIYSLCLAYLTLAPLGGGAKGPPCGFSQIAPEVQGISLWNLPYLSGQQFHTLCLKIGTQVIIGQPWVTSEWRHVSPILTSKMGLRNRRHWCSFKATINWLIWNDVELVGLQNWYLGFSKFWKFWKFSKKMSNFFSFQDSFPPNQKFQKTVRYVRGQCFMNMCTKFQVDIFKNGWDIAQNMSKTATFHVISGLYRDFPNFVFWPILTLQKVF